MRTGGTVAGFATTKKFRWKKIISIPFIKGGTEFGVYHERTQ
jgi:hypothetical protein